MEDALKLTLSDALLIYEQGGGTLTGSDAEEGKLLLDVVLKWGMDGSGAVIYLLCTFLVYSTICDIFQFREAQEI